MNLKLNWDAVGIATSVTCAIHCALLPILVTTLPVFGVNIVHNLFFEWGMIILAFIIGSYSLFHGFMKHHRSLVPVLIFSFGFTFLVLKQFYTQFNISFYWLRLPVSLSLIFIITGCVIAANVFLHIISIDLAVMDLDYIYNSIKTVWKKIVLSFVIILSFITVSSQSKDELAVPYCSWNAAPGLECRKHRPVYGWLLAERFSDVHRCKKRVTHGWTNTLNNYKRIILIQRPWVNWILIYGS